MPDHDPAIDDAVREIANLLATAYLRIRFPDRAGQVDSPSPYVSRVRLKAKHLIHGGVIGGSIDSVSAGTLVTGYLRGAPPSTNPSWTPVGRILSIIGRPEGATPYFSTKVTSWDQTTGTINVTPDPNGIVQEGDCFVLRFNVADWRIAVG